MKTNFFKIINHLQSPGSWTLHISPAIDGKMIVSVLLSDPVSEKEGIVLSPMIFNETIENLDNTFFASLMEPVKEISEIFVNCNEIQKSLENARKLLKEKQKASKETKADEGAKKKQNYEDTIKKVGELNSQCKYHEAIALLDELTGYEGKQADLDKLRQELETKSKQLSLL